MQTNAEVTSQEKISHKDNVHDDNNLMSARLQRKKKAPDRYDQYKQ
jgi:hypothetical protein